MARGFVENAGQIDNEAVRFYATAGRMALGFEDDALLFKLAGEAGRSVLVRLAFDGAQKVVARGEGERSARTHYFLGGGSASWRTHVRSFDRVVYQDLYPGIDLVYAVARGAAKYEFRLDAGADPASIRWTYQGIEALAVDASGGLVVGTEVGNIHDDVPRSEQGDEAVRCAFVLEGPAGVCLDCEGWDRSRPGVIDPLVYATFLGGSGSDDIDGLAVDASGNAFVTGHASPPPDFPVTPGAFDEEGGDAGDVFVTKLGATGELVYSTFLGGRFGDQGHGLALDGLGFAFVTGFTSSDDFPVTPGAYATVNVGGAFVTKLSQDGSALVYSTYFGSGNTRGDAVAVGPDGSAFMVGETNSSTLPVTPGAFDTAYGGEISDIYVAKLSPDGGALLYSSYLGGDGIDGYASVAVDATGAAYVAGFTSSDEGTFPVTAGAFDETFADPDVGLDGFVVKVSPVGDELLWATYIGGTSNDWATGVAVDGAGAVYVSGWTLSDEGTFPVTAGAFDTSYGGHRDGFVVKIAPGGDQIIYGTYLGGSNDDGWVDVAIDGAGQATVAGATLSADFPTTATGLDGTYNMGCDAFIARLDPAGSVLQYGTFLGGGGRDCSTATSHSRRTGVEVAVDEMGDVYVASETTSADFPVTAGAFDETFNGEMDGYVAKLDLGAGAAALDCGAAVASVEALWPPNHGWVQVSISGLGTAAVIVDGVTQDEPTDGLGDGSTCPDAKVGSDGTVDLRAERAGSGDGRVYGVAFTAAGASGVSCSGTVTVCVPHDQGLSSCADGGALYDSLACGP